MKKRFLMIILLLYCTINLFAAWIEKAVQTLEQPDGTVIEAFASGDEYHNWIHNEEGYTIILDVETGYYCWADELDGDLVSTGLPIHEVSPFTRGLAPGRNISEQRYKEKAQPMLSSYEGREYTRTTGNLTNLVIFIKFLGDTEFPGSFASFNNVFNGDTGSAVKGFFKTASYNQLFVNTTLVTPTTNLIVSYTAPNPRNYYLPYSGSNPSGYTDRAAVEFTLLKDVITAIESQVPTDIVLDNLNPGFIDNVCFIARGSAVSSTILWPHRWVMGGYANFYIPPEYVVTIHGKKMYDFNLNIESYSNDASTLCHELTHSCGSPDFYRYSYSGPDPVGRWCLMNQNESPPQSQTSHIKEKYLNWITIKTVTKSGVYTLEPITVSKDNHSIKILSPNSDTEYFIAEYRYKGTTGQTDSSLPGSGLLVHRINTRNADNTINNDGNRNGPPDELYIYRPGASNNSQTGTLDSAHFSSGVSRTAINSTTNPPPFLYGGGTVAPGGLNISGIGAATSSNISFTVTLDNEPRTFTAVHNSGPKTVTCSWTAPLQYASKVTKYNVYRESDSVATLVHSTANNSTLTYNDNVSAVGGLVKYYVTAVYAAGESNPSNISSDIPLGTYTDIAITSFTGPAIISSTQNTGKYELTLKNNSSTNLSANTYEITYYKENSPVPISLKTVSVVPAIAMTNTYIHEVPVSEMLTLLDKGFHQIYAEVKFTTASGLTDNVPENNKSSFLTVENRFYDVLIEDITIPSFLPGGGGFSVKVKNNGTTTIPGSQQEIKLYKIDDNEQEVLLSTKTGITLTSGSSGTITFTTNPELTTIQNALSTNGIHRVFARVNFTTASSLTDENPTNNASEVYTLLYVAGTTPKRIGEGTVASAVLPLSYSDKASLSQTIYTADQIGGRSKISYLSWTFQGNGDIASNINIPFTVYMTNTAKTNFEGADSWVDYDDFEVVFEGKLIDVFSASEKEIFIEIEPPFEFDGTNLVIMVNKPLYTTAYNVNNTFKSTARTSSSISAVQDASSFTPQTSFPVGIIKNEFPNIRIIAEPVIIPDVYDIAITDFTAPTELPNETNFQTTIKNLGNKEFNRTDYELYYYIVASPDDIELIKITEGLQDLEPDDSFVHELNGSAFISKLSDGIHQIYAIVKFTDESGYIDDDTSNNQSEEKEVFYEIAVYDLSISYFTGPSSLPNQSDFEVTIKNEGNRDVFSDDYSISFYRQNAVELDLILYTTSDTLISISPDETTILTFNGSLFTNLLYGENFIYAIVEFKVHEDANMENNISTILQVNYTTSAKDVQKFDYQTSLIGNYPNPFNPTTIIKYNLESPDVVTIEIYNIKGQRVRTLLNEYRNIGEHSIVWNGEDDAGLSVSSGMFFYKMTTGDYIEVKKMIMLK